MDEPTTGLDPATRKQVWECLEKLRKEDNMTIFLTTHYMEEAAKASHIAILDAGHIKEYGTPFALKESYAKDHLKLYPCSEKLENLLSNMQTEYTKNEGHLIIPLVNSLAALPVLESVKCLIEGFEMVQGSMDDVFLNVTGKKLEE